MKLSTLHTRNKFAVYPTHRTSFMIECFNTREKYWYNLTQVKRNSCN